MISPNLTATIVGGGASAHTMIPLLSSSEIIVNLMTRKPELWQKNLELQYQDFDGNVIERFHGELNKISSDPADVIGDADVIILGMPVSKYREALHRLAPHIDREKKVFVGTVYGQAGFDWMVNEIKAAFGLDNVVAFSIGLIPWICRTVEYGKIGVTYGVKPINIAAVSPNEYFEYLNENFLRKVCLDWFGKGAFQQAKHFISLTLSVDNQILHPARCYGLFTRYGGEWESLDDVPFFYADFDQLSADVLTALDADYSKIRNRIREMYPDREFPLMMDYLTQDKYTNITPDYTVLESILESNTLGAIKAPTIQTEDGRWKIDTNHRFFTDDIQYGLCIAKWFAEVMDIDVPTIDRIITWAQDLRGEELIGDGRLLLDSPDLNQRFISGVPHFYGYRSVDDVIG